MYARLLRAAVAEYERENIDGEIADLQRVLADGKKYRQTWSTR